MHLQSTHLQGSPFLPQPQSDHCDDDDDYDDDDDNGDNDDDDDICVDCLVKELYVWKRNGTCTL